MVSWAAQLQAWGLARVLSPAVSLAELVQASAARSTRRTFSAQRLHLRGIRVQKVSSRLSMWALLTAAGVIFGFVTALLTAGTDDIGKYLLSAVLMGVIYTLVMVLCFSLIVRRRT